jgi:hypothetical protein
MVHLSLLYPRIEEARVIELGDSGSSSCVDGYGTISGISLILDTKFHLVMTTSDSDFGGCWWRT